MRHFLNPGKTWVSDISVPEKGLSFQEFYELLDRTFFTASQPVLLRQCVEDLHGFLVREVLKVMSKYTYCTDSSQYKEKVIS